jgi:hypothetical protein
LQKDISCILLFYFPQDLLHITGKRHAYSNLGYLILGRVIETVTGIPYVNFVQEICGPVTILPGCAKQSDCHPLEVCCLYERFLDQL